MIKFKLIYLGRKILKFLKAVSFYILRILLGIFSPSSKSGAQLQSLTRSRVSFCAAVAIILYAAVTTKLYFVASNDQSSRTPAGQVKTHDSREDIVDRNGHVLATNIETHSLYAHPHQIIDLETTIASLSAIFPGIDRDKLRKDLSPGKKFAWIRRRISPEQMEMVHNIGEPGLLFGTREMRFYPNENLAAHILGGYRFGHEGVNSAEIIGVAGAEAYFNDRLNAADGKGPVRLSIDLATQHAVEDILDGGIKMLNAKGASAVIMEVQTGKIRAMASLPDFNPNDRPTPLLEGDPADSPLFNRALQGVYELGSVFKTLTVAQALDLGLVSPGSMVETKGPMVVGRFRIRDFKDYGDYNSVKDIMVKSSNIGTARLAQMIGPNRQKDFLDALGVLHPTGLELIEAEKAKPIWPPRWSNISSYTISYGHGLSTSPVHLAAAYATIMNGGIKVRPTLSEDKSRTERVRVIKETTSKQMQDILRAVVTEGTASFARNTGYSIGGKTGSADKVKPTGGYYKDKVLATFAVAVPAIDPEFIMIITFDEGKDTTLGYDTRTAGWTAVPVTAELVRRVGPILDIPFTPEPDPTPKKK